MSHYQYSGTIPDSVLRHGPWKDTGAIFVAGDSNGSATSKASLHLMTCIIFLIL